jgi:hypothetical protein
VGFTAKWALIPKLRPFEANTHDKYLNPVPDNPVPDISTVLYTKNPCFLNPESGPWGWGSLGTRMGSPPFLSEITAVVSQITAP